MCGGYTQYIFDGEDAHGEHIKPVESARVAVVNLGGVFDQHRHDTGHNEPGNGSLNGVAEAVFEFWIKQPFVGQREHRGVVFGGVISHGCIFSYAMPWQAKKKAPIKGPIRRMECF